MPALSAGLLPFRRRPVCPEVLLGHMGGPFWARKDEGAWSIPKGLPLPGETCSPSPVAKPARRLASTLPAHSWR